VDVDKADFKAERKDLYSPSAKDFSVVDVPSFHFAMIEGHGDPNTSTAYAAAVEALYSVSYATKFASKLELGRDYVVGPLEGLWTADDPSAFTSRTKSDWSWTMLIRQPDWITAQVRDLAIAKASEKNLPALESLRFDSFAEGLSVQILHIGSYDDEAPTIARLHDEFLPAHGYIETGPHHEIYLSDPRKVAPAKLKTILRQPVAPKGES
jgi:hypothetical protein